MEGNSQEERKDGKIDEKVDMRICGGMDDDFRNGGCERGGGV